MKVSNLVTGAIVGGVGIASALAFDGYISAIFFIFGLIIGVILQQIEG